MLKSARVLPDKGKRTTENVLVTYVLHCIESNKSYTEYWTSIMILYVLF